VGVTALWSVTFAALVRLPELARRRRLDGTFRRDFSSGNVLCVPHRSSVSPVEVEARVSWVRTRVALDDVAANLRLNEDPEAMIPATAVAEIPDTGEWSRPVRELFHRVEDVPDLRSETACFSTDGLNDVHFVFVGLVVIGAELRRALRRRAFRRVYATAVFDDLDFVVFVEFGD